LISSELLFNITVSRPFDNKEFLQTLHYQKLKGAAISLCKNLGSVRVVRLAQNICNFCGMKIQWFLQVIDNKEINGAGGGNRTHMTRRPGDFESPASTNFTTPARRESII
jgi:hypothetical protein